MRWPHTCAPVRAGSSLIPEKYSMQPNPVLTIARKSMGIRLDTGMLNGSSPVPAVKTSVIPKAPASCAAQPDVPVKLGDFLLLIKQKKSLHKRAFRSGR